MIVKQAVGKAGGIGRRPIQNKSCSKRYKRFRSNTFTYNRRILSHGFEKGPCKFVLCILIFHDVCIGKQFLISIKQKSSDLSRTLAIALKIYENFAVYDGPYFIN